MATPDPDLTAQIKVILTTTDEDIQLPDSKRQLFVPSDLRRYGLSRILNSECMLATPSPIPFDFLVNGAFLRSSLADYLRENGLSIESTITLQYVRSLIPPVYQASFEHDDWVSAVDVLSQTSPAGQWSGDKFRAGQDRLLSASYDGLLRIWNASGNVVATSPTGILGGHTAGIRTARFASATQVVSAGLDRTVRVWKYSESANDTDEAGVQGQLRARLELYGHTASVDRFDLHEPSRRILTASADGCIGVWSTSKKECAEAAASVVPSALFSTKRRRTTKPQSSVSTPQGGPLALMHLHAAPASAAIFDPRDRSVAYSAALDHTVRTIDLTTAREVAALTSSHALLSLCALPRSGSPPLLAAGTSARHIMLVDPRVATHTTSVMTLRGHVNKVVSLAPAPGGDSAYSLVSASHDGMCRVWDLRSVRPARGDEGGLGSVTEAVYVVERDKAGGKRLPASGDGYKVFDVVWDATLGIVSGGEDRRVQVNKGQDLMGNKRT